MYSFFNQASFLSFYQGPKMFKTLLVGAAFVSHSLSKPTIECRGEENISIFLSKVCKWKWTKINCVIQMTMTSGILPRTRALPTTSATRGNSSWQSVHRAHSLIKVRIRILSISQWFESLTNNFMVSFQPIRHADLSPLPTAIIQVTDVEIIFVCGAQIVTYGLNLQLGEPRPSWMESAPRYT